MCVFPSGPHKASTMENSPLVEYFWLKTTNPKLFGESQPFFGPCSFKIAERKPPSLIFLDGGILDHAFGPPNKPNTKLLCELMFSSQTTFVLEKMPLRTPPVATLRANSCVFSWSEKKALPQTQKLTTLWANEPGMFSSIYLLTEELFGTLKITRLGRWPPEALQLSGRPSVVTASNRGRLVRPSSHYRRRFCRWRGRSETLWGDTEGGFGILAGSRIKLVIFGWPPQKTL